MSQAEIEKILHNAAYSMEMEGFQITNEQRQECAAALAGQGRFVALLQKYIKEAKKLGTINA